MSKKALTEAQIIAENEKRMQERVKLTLYRDKTHTDPVYVSVGSYKALIPRGKEVSLPRFAAAVIQQSLEQDADTAVRVEELERGFDEAAKSALA